MILGSASHEAPRGKPEVADNQTRLVIEAKPTPPPFGLSRALIALWAAGLALRLAFIWLEPTTAPVADETMWLMALTRIPAAGFSPFSSDAANT